MQDLFMTGIIAIIAISILIYKSILFVIHMMHLDKTNEMIDRNLAHIRMTNHQTQQIQKTISSIENVIDWKMDDPRIISDDLRQQFLMKTKTKKTPSSGRASPRERIPLATTDFDDISEGDNDSTIVPIYTYNPIVRGTQV